MKISIGKTFDTGQIIKSFKEIGVKGAEEFVTYFSDLSTQLVNALRGTLTLEENLNTLVKTVSMTDNTRFSFTLTGQNAKKTPKHIIVTRAYPITNAVTSFGWQILQDGSVEVLATFNGTPTSSVDVTLVIFF